MTQVNGKRVYVSGAGSGIGYQTALAAARAGASIFATDIQAEGLANLKAEIENNGGQCDSAILDVSNEEATRALIAGLKADGKLPQIAINNAGIAYVAPFLETDAEMWGRTFAINVFGLAHASRLFAAAWRKANITGHLVNISSMASVAPPPALSAYSASKYAVEGLSEVLALELAPYNIEVTCIHPGVINTPIIDKPDMAKISDAQFDALRQHYMEEGVTPDVVARDIIAGIEANKSNVYSGKGVGIAVMAKRLLSRGAFRKMAAKSARRIGYLWD